MMTNKYNRHQVYIACMLAYTRGYDWLAFDDACSKHNKGEYESDIYQNIASKYFQEAQQLGYTNVWALYTCYKVKKEAERQEVDALDEFILEMERSTSLGIM